MTHKPIRLTRFTRLGVAAILTLFTMLGLVVGAGPAQAASPSPVGKTKTIIAPLSLQGKGGPTTNSTVTGTCGSIHLELELVSPGIDMRITFGYKSTQGPVRSHNLQGVYVNAPTFTTGFFGDVGFPNLAEFETSDLVTIGNPVAATATLTVQVLTPSGRCFGVVGDGLLG